MVVHASAPRRHALLVGIDAYPNFKKSQQLVGCVRDVHAMKQVLEDRFDFTKVTLLANDQATQSGIRAALDALEDDVRPGDIVVIFYSGHGSRVKVLGRPSKWMESIVPHDSGRDPNPNLDITDEEIHLRLFALSETTPYITLIFDSCFSAGIKDTRKGEAAGTPEAGKARLVEYDPRPLEPFLPSSPRPAYRHARSLYDDSTPTSPTKSLCSPRCLRGR